MAADEDWDAFLEANRSWLTAEWVARQVRHRFEVPVRERQLPPIAERYIQVPGLGSRVLQPYLRPGVFDLLLRSNEPATVAMGAHHLAVACAMAAMTPHLVEWSAVSEVPFDEWTAHERLMATRLMLTAAGSVIHRLPWLRRELPAVPVALGGTGVTDLVQHYLDGRGATRAIAAKRLPWPRWRLSPDMRVRNPPTVWVHPNDLEILSTPRWGRSVS